MFKPFPDDGQELSGEALEALREWLQSSGLKEAKRVVEKMVKIGEDEDGYDDGVIAAGGTKKSDVRQALAGICGGYNSFLKLNASLINVIHQAKDRVAKEKRAFEDIEVQMEANPPKKRPRSDPEESAAAAAETEHRRNTCDFGLLHKVFCATSVNHGHICHASTDYLEDLLARFMKIEEMELMIDDVAADSDDDEELPETFMIPTEVRGTSVQKKTTELSLPDLRFLALSGIVDRVKIMAVLKDQNKPSVRSFQSANFVCYLMRVA